MDWWSLLDSVPGLGLLVRTIRRGWLKMFGQGRARVFEDLEALQFAYPRAKVFEGRGDVHALWLSGHGVLPHVSAESASLARVILPPPDWPYLQFLEESLGQDRDYSGEVHRMVDRAKDIGAETRICRDFPGIQLTFYRPDSWWAGYVNIETSLPFMGTRGQPTFQIRKRSQKHLYDRLLSSYERLWGESVEPAEVLR